MTHDEYKEKLKQLEETYQKEKKQLAVKYAMSNNTVKIGDVIEDFTGTRIKVDRISIDNGWLRPQCAYIGFEITKQGNLYKDKRRAFVFQMNLKKEA